MPQSDCGLLRKEQDCAAHWVLQEFTELRTAVTRGAPLRARCAALDRLVRFRDDRCLAVRPKACERGPTDRVPIRNGRAAATIAKARPSHRLCRGEKSLSASRSRRRLSGSIVVCRTRIGHRPASNPYAIKTMLLAMASTRSSTIDFAQKVASTKLAAR